MLWDSGLGRLAAIARAPLRRGADLPYCAARRIHVRPEQIDVIALSHMHSDHVGQAASFPQARLLIGEGDWEALKASRPDSLAP